MGISIGSFLPMPIEETSLDRVERLSALWLETAAASLAPSLAAALAMALQALPKGDVILPLGHAVSLSAPVVDLVTAAGRGVRLVGTVDALSSCEFAREQVRASVTAAMFVQAPTVRPVMPLPEFIWQARQAGLPVLVVCADPNDALGLADAHVDLIVTGIGDLGIVAGLRDRLQSIAGSPWATIGAVPAVALPPTCAWLEKRLSEANQIGQIDEVERKAGALQAHWLKSHGDGTLTDGGSVAR